MIKTEQKHWVNGYQIRGGYFRTYTFDIFALGFMLVWGKGVRARLSIFKLI